jgi:hypothetical protein
LILVTAWFRYQLRFRDTYVIAARVGGGCNELFNLPACAMDIDGHWLMAACSLSDR